MLWFNVAHYALRPWPWIFTALAAIVLYPGLAHPETSYMMIVNEHVPHALRGIIFAGFLAAFMSTIATQLNWGTSYLVEDFYRRFFVRHATRAALRARLAGGDDAAGDRHAASFRATGVDSFGMASGAGTGRGNGERLSAALVLVADQRVERNFLHGHSAGYDFRAALGGIVDLVDRAADIFPGSAR